MGAQLTVFRSKIPWEQQRIGAAAIYCSDGRYNDQTDEFLHRQLRLPRYDRVVIPGGAACMAPYTVAMIERGALEKQLRFLIDAHELSRIVLIGHEDCGFYKRIPRPRMPLDEQQRRDLAQIAGVIGGWNRNVEVQAYFARKVQDIVQFEPVPALR